MEGYIEEKLNLFAPDKYLRAKAGECVCFGEPKPEGQAKIRCTCGNESLIFPVAEQNVFPYLDETKKGARACADVFAFTHGGDGWDLHIMELKKTIDTANFAKSKEQFRMGIYNGRALAAFLGMKVREVYLYSGFRNDKISAISAENLIAIRAQNNGEILKLIKEWTSQKCSLQIDMREKSYPLQKIALDTEGKGAMTL